jgi:hypothetical protein
VFPNEIERLAAAVCERVRGVWGNIDFLRLPLRKAPHDDKRLMAVQMMFVLVGYLAARDRIWPFSAAPAVLLRVGHVSSVTSFHDMIRNFDHQAMDVQHAE